MKRNNHAVGLAFWVSIIASVGFAGSVNPVLVNSTAALKQAVSQAKPGDIITLADGRYKEACKLSGNGAAGKPIVIQAQTMGKADFLEAVTIRGKYLSFTGAAFSGKGGVAIAGQNCRLSRCRFTNVQSGKWVTVGRGSKNIEIDHCLFEKKEINRRMRRSCQLIQITVLNKDEKHYIHHNHFRDIPKGASGNGFETLQLITNGNPKDPKGDRTGIRVEYNLFEHCDGEAEIISVKSNGNEIRGNTFRDCKGELVLRQGHRNVVNGNWFIGGSGGVRLQGRDQVVVNNYFADLGSGLKMMNGINKDGRPFYVRVERARIAHNTFINCQKTFVVGLNHSQCPPGVVPKDCVIANNILYHSPDAKSPHIQLIDNRKPENWVWKGNIYQGKLGVDLIDGLNAGDPGLQGVGDGIALPTPKTPTGELLEDINGADKGIGGAVRGGKVALGAIQFSTQMPKVSPLTVEDVGPNAVLHNVKDPSHAQ